MRGSRSFWVKKQRTWWAPSAAQDKKGRSTAGARQREDKSGPGNLHNGLAEEARSPGSCTSTRAVGCSLRGSTQILQLKVKRCVQREDGSSLGSLHDGLAREARGPGSRTSTRITHFAPDDIQRVATKHVFQHVSLSLTFLF